MEGELPTDRMSREAQPDFLIIGAMKCATSTLHVQLASQSGFHMSEPKEPNFFSDDEVYAKGMAWYRSLFEGASEDALRGESSTHYTKLPVHPHTLERLRDTLGKTPLKLIYVMRHPVDRLVSHYIHEWSQGVYSGGIAEEVERHPEMMDFGRYAMQLKPWIEAFGTASILPVFSDSLRQHPQRTLERVCAFLGHEGAVQWNHQQGDQNVSAVRMRRSWMRRFAAIGWVRWMRRTFVPVAWRQRVKKRWVMDERPQLDDAMRAKLEQEFDRDLAELGAMVGMELHCANWKDVAADAEPQWATEDA
ncbi:MAG: sulfotransferase domain-containing protein [Planctomycetota bacterium]